MSAGWRLQRTALRAAAEAPVQGDGRAAALAAVQGDGRAAGLAQGAWVLGVVLLLARMPAAGAQADAAAESSVLGEVAFELNNGKPYLKVQVGGGAGPTEHWFILDSACAVGCLVGREAAVAIGLEVRNERMVHAGAGEGEHVPMGTAGPVAFTVGGVAFTESQVAVMPMTHLDRYEGRRADGLLGAPFFQRYVVEIDYAERRIRMHHRERFLYEGDGHVIPYRLDEGFVVTRGRIEAPGRLPLEGDFVVDTSARPAILVHGPALDRFDLAGGLAARMEGVIGAGAGGTARGIVGRIDRFTLGGFVAEGPVAIFSLDRTGFLAGERYEGIAGSGLLERCRVFFDHQGGRLILEPADGADAPYRHDNSGLILAAEGARFERIVVVSVLSNSGAAAAGFESGDVVKVVDGRRAEEWTLEELRQSFLERGHQMLFEIERNGARLDLVLPLEERF